MKNLRRRPAPPARCSGINLYLTLREHPPDDLLVGVYPRRLESKPMSDENSLKGRVTRQGEEVVGRVAQGVLENPMVAGALSRAFETRERAVRAQEVAMGALNLPSASDLERLTRRIRSVSQRLEGIEDALDRLDQRLNRADGTRGLEERLEKIEASLERLETAGAEAPSKPSTT
jgi:hypothetical protein